MTIKRKILREFFHTTKPPATPKNKIINTDLVNEQNSSNIKSHTHFKIFDDPLEEIKNKNLGQSSDKLRTNLGQSSDKLRTEPRTKLRTNLGQSSNKNINLITFSSLTGLQKEIVLCIYEQCKLSREKVTSPLSIEYLANSCKTTKLSAQKTTQRLEKRDIITRVEYKNGRSGWTRYSLPESIFQEVLHTETFDKLRTNLGQSSDKLRTEPRTEPRTNDSSSSNIYIYNKTTTTTELPGFPPEWNEIDFEELHQRKVHFGKNHLLQFSTHLLNHTAFEFQESIDAFVYDIDHNHIQARKGLLNLFIGAIRGGTLYISSNYVSPYQAKINEMAKLYEQREEKKFLVWLEEHQDDVLQQLQKQSPSLTIDFQYRGKESLTWVKKHIYPKKTQLA